MHGGDGASACAGPLNENHQIPSELVEKWDVGFGKNSLRHGLGFSWSRTAICKQCCTNQYQSAIPQMRHPLIPSAMLGLPSSSPPSCTGGINTSLRARRSPHRCTQLTSIACIVLVARSAPSERPL